MKFGDPILVTTGTDSRLGVYLSRKEGCEPAIFLSGRIELLDLDATLTPWRCPACHGLRAFWFPRVFPRCAVCEPPSLGEQEFIMKYTAGATQHLASKLDDPSSKTILYRSLDDAVASGEWWQLARTALEMVVANSLLKHGRGDLL